MKGPSYPHCCKLYGENCLCHRFVCTLLVRGVTWDVWSENYGYSVLFRWGSDGAEYFSARVSEFPLRSSKSADDRNLWTKDPTVRDLNNCWKQVRNRFDNPRQEERT